MQPNFYNGYYPQQSLMKIDYISNIEEAKKYPTTINGSSYLLDTEQPILYLKTCDTQGKTNLRAFNLVEIDPNKIVDSRYITREDFDSFKNEILNAIKKGE